jgi:hypothetical protein
METTSDRCSRSFARSWRKRSRFFTRTGDLFPHPQPGVTWPTGKPSLWESGMQTLRYVYWQEDDAWLGYLRDYPDYWTQGETLDDLIAHLADLCQELTNTPDA